MMCVERDYSFRGAFSMSLRGGDDLFTRYITAEYSAFEVRQANGGAKEAAGPHIRLDVVEAIETEQSGDIWAIGGGLFYHENSDTMLVSAAGSSTSFSRRELYIALRGFVNSSGNIRVQVCPGHKPKALYSRWLRLDPVPPLERAAETFVSQILEPIFYRVFLQQGIVLLHAAAVEKGGRALLLLGSRNTGKTSTTLRLCELGWNFLGDDLCLLSRDGHVFAYPKLLKLESDYLAQYPGVLSKLSEMRSFTDRLRFRLWGHTEPLRLTKNLELKVAPHLMDLRIGDAAEIGTVVFLQRVHPAQKRLQSLSNRAAVELVQGHERLEFDVMKRQYNEMRASLGLVYPDRGLSALVDNVTARIVAESLKNTKAYILFFPDVFEAEVGKMIEEAASDLL
jgi:hypothetical protein